MDSFGAQITSSLGSVIKDVMTEREAIWVVSQHQLAPPEPKSAPSSGSNPTTSAAIGKNIVGELRDGTVLCKAFQNGRCATSGRECAAGQHRCGHLLKAGRVCGSYQHQWQSLQQQAACEE